MYVWAYVNKVFRTDYWTVISNISKNSKIASVPEPSIKQQVQSFLILTGYYRDFINNYAKLASPLAGLLKKNVDNKIVWKSHLIA